MHDVVLARLVERAVIALLVEVNEVVGIDSLQLCLCGGSDVDLIILLHISPLCLSVEPYGSDGRRSLELTSFDEDGAAGVTHGTRHLEIGLDTILYGDVGCGLVEYTLSTLRKGTGTHQCHCYQKTNLFHINIFI